MEEGKWEMDADETRSVLLDPHGLDLKRTREEIMRNHALMRNYQGGNRGKSGSYLHVPRYLGGLF